MVNIIDIYHKIDKNDNQLKHFGRSHYFYRVGKKE